MVRLLLGPDQTMRKLDTTGGGAWQSFGSDPRSTALQSHAVYDVGKTLVAGGGVIEGRA